MSKPALRLVAWTALVLMSASCVTQSATEGETTETQMARLIGSTPLQIELTLVTTSSYIPSNTPAKHMLAFYVPWSSIASEKFDGT